MFHDGFMGGGMWFIWLFWIVIVGLIVYLIIRVSNQSKHTTSDESALDILKKRYARGEITKEEYDKMKMDLQ